MPKSLIFDENVKKNFVLRRRVPLGSLETVFYGCYENEIYKSTFELVSGIYRNYDPHKRKVFSCWNATISSINVSIQN